MSTSLDTKSSTDSKGGGGFPAYGPIDAILGYILFYVLVDRATPTVVVVLTDVLSDVSPSLIRLGLAMVLWFILVVTVLDQVRRQLGALGIDAQENGNRGVLADIASTELQPLTYLVLVLVGGVVAAITFERAVETAVSMIRIVPALDAASFVPTDIVVMVVFFVSFGVATHALDRVAIGGLRRMLSG